MRYSERLLHQARAELESRVKGIESLALDLDTLHRALSPSIREGIDWTVCALRAGDDRIILWASDSTKAKLLPLLLTLGATSVRTNKCDGQILRTLRMPDMTAPVVVILPDSPPEPEAQAAAMANGG